MASRAKICFISLIIITSTSLIASWTEHTFAQLSRRQKIGQLFMIAVTANTDSLFFLSQSPYRMNQAYCESIITNYQVGGIIFLGTGSVEQQVTLTRHYQSLSAVPLLVGIDAEWGLKMRISNGMRFPYAMTLGALKDEELIYQTGYTIGKQSKALGIHLNCAPVLDVATNPENPVINYRSFGQDPQAVARKGMLFARGLRDAGIIACAKHFPGHGDTLVDSHYALPCINHSKERLEATELFPFVQAIQNGIPALMTGHLAVPALDPTTTPASASSTIIKELLGNQLGFNGLIITDGLGMRGITNNQAPGQVEYTALLAGNDILLCPTDVPHAVQLIEQALESGELSEQELDKKVLKILHAKEWAFKQTTTRAEHFLPAAQLKKELYFKALTLAANDTNILPIAPDAHVATITFGCTSKNVLGQELAAHCAQSFTYNTTAHPAAEELKELEKRLTEYDTIVIGLFSMNHYSSDQFGINSAVYTWIQKMNEQKKVILSIFGSPYSLALFDAQPAIIMAYEDTPETQLATAQTIQGMYTPTGTLPVSASERFSCGTGL